MNDQRHKELMPITVRYLGIEIRYDEDCDSWKLPDDADEYSLMSAKRQIDSLIKDEQYDQFLPILAYATHGNMTGTPTLVEIIEVKKNGDYIFRNIETGLVGSAYLNFWKVSPKSESVFESINKLIESAKIEWAKLQRIEIHTPSISEG
jgi:hypothetical protein